MSSVLFSYAHRSFVDYLRAPETLVSRCSCSLKPGAGVALNRVRTLLTSRIDAPATECYNESNGAWRAGHGA